MNAIVSCSVKIGPQDKRCGYWAKVVRAERVGSLPLPYRVETGYQIPGAFLKHGEEELFPGDVMIQGEANHHRHFRGWSYWVSWCDENGEYHSLLNPAGAGIKAAIKEAGHKDLLAGAGYLAACVRVAHALNRRVEIPE